MTTLFDAALYARAASLLDALKGRGLTLATAESCTGGLIAGLLTEVPGSSAVIEAGFITYADRAKETLLGVRRSTLQAHGAVSELTAREMAEGALNAAGSGLAVAVTGIAGPGGGTAEKPVGLVHLAMAQKNGPTLHARQVFTGDRTAVRLKTVAAALALVEQGLPPVVV